MRTLLHYEIVEKIGAGGMGEVYRAIDSKLGREVAIKMLPAELSRHPDRVARLRREAHVLAVLNHPNIATIYDLGEEDGVFFLVLEYVPGKTLAEILQSGAVPLREALPIGRQIAEALEAAHDKGVLHRDLKPANVKITPEGRVKLLDFGLAKAELVGDSSDELNTRSEFTEPGKVMGTASYMSPEQARGRALDKRTDIWAFGCVMYEVLSGHRLYTGATTQDIIAAILRDDPKLDALPADTPPSVRLMLERCLRHDISRRLRDMGDARIELEEAHSSGALAAAASVATPAEDRANPRAFSPAMVMVAALLLIALSSAASFAAMHFLRGRSASTSAQDIQFQAITDLVGMEESPAISPDGKTVAFVARAKGHRHIWLRLLAGGTPLQITHAETDHEQPRWAPDSGTIIYFTAPATSDAQGALWEISALGSAPRRICEALNGGDISHDGKRIATFQRQGREIAPVVLGRDGSGGVRLKPLSDDYGYDSIRWSPDDSTLAFHTTAGIFDESLYLLPATGGDPQRIIRGFSIRGFSWLPDGSGFAYASALGSTIPYPPTYNLRVIDKDGKNDRQITFGDVSYEQPDVHASGKLVVERVRMQSDIWKFPVSGSPTDNARNGVRITHQTAQVQTPSVSPKGDELVYLSDSGGHGNLWIAKTDGSGVRQLTFEHGSAAVGVPVWSPAGSPIAFILTRDGKTLEMGVNPDGGGMRTLVNDGVAAYWSNDGQWLYYTSVVNNDTASEKDAVQKVRLSGGAPVVVRKEDARMCGISADSIFFARRLKDLNGGWDWELGKASPENGPLVPLAPTIAGARIPVGPNYLHFVLSPDEKTLAAGLTDDGTTNLWGVPTVASTPGGSMRKLVDFGEHAVVIARRVAWSPDSKFLYAAVAETDADVVLIDGLIPKNVK